MHFNFQLNEDGNKLKHRTDVMRSLRSFAQSALFINYCYLCDKEITMEAIGVGVGE